MIIFDFGALIK